MRITLVISRFGAGGAERVLSIMANYWATHQQDVTLITIASEDTDTYALHPEVKRIGLNLEVDSKHLAAAIWNNVRRLIRLRSAIRACRPNVVISFVDTTNVMTLLASFGLRVPVIVSERSNPYHHAIGKVWTRLRSLIYRHADGLVVQSHGLREWASGFVRDNAIHVIPNPVKPVRNDVEYPSNRQGAGHTVVAIGRLSSEKSFDLLLRAFCQCAKVHDDWSLIILGEGEERRSLETLAVELGLQGRVSLVGLVKDPAPVLQGADLFVLSSSYEGFPNALLEAMACGLAVISTDCGSGAREIICNGVNGVLVACNDVDALATAMNRLMADRTERQRLGMRAKEVLERFSVQSIMNKWDDLLTDVCQGVASHEGTGLRSHTGSAVRIRRKLEPLPGDRQRHSHSKS